MRKFRHKPSGEIFTQKNDLEMIGLKDSESDGFTLPTWLLEQGNDWEEVKEIKKVSELNVKEEPNYLITAFESNKNNAIYKINSSGKYEHQNKNSYNADRLIELGFIIISVKNHIGIEYKIGDKFKSPLSENKFKIAGFTIKNDIMYVCTECNYKFNINDLDNIILSNEVKSPIYTTTDGVDIKEGSHLVLYLVNKELNTLYSVEINGFSKEDAKIASRYLTFTSEENRDKYIKENSKKPIFVSADGVELFEEPEYVYSVLTKGLWPMERNYFYNHKYKSPEWKHFVTKEARQEYIDNNKPKYSLADIEKSLNGMIISYTPINKENIINRLKKLGK